VSAGGARGVGGVGSGGGARSWSCPASMPFLVVMSLIGVRTVFRPRRGDEPGPASLRVPVVGAAVGGIGAITIPFINQRYVSDFVPLLVLLGIAGLHTLLRGVDRGGRTKALMGGVAVVPVVLAAASPWVNFALALLYQREYSPFPTEAERAAFVRFQYDFADSLTGGTSTNVRVGRRLPAPLPEGTVFVLGNCDAVYWSDGSTWHPIERTRAAGRGPPRGTLPPPPPPTHQAP